MNNLIIMPGMGGASLAELAGLNVPTAKPNVANPVPKLNLPCNQDKELSRKKFLEMYPDVAHKGVDPWDYYVKQGLKEKKTWPGPECPSLRWSSFPRCTVPFNKTRAGMKKDAMGRWTGIDANFGNRTCRYMYEDTLVNGLPWEEAPHCPASNVDKIWIGTDKKSWGHVTDNDYDCEYAPKVLMTASNKCPPCAASNNIVPPKGVATHMGMVTPPPPPVIRPVAKPVAPPKPPPLPLCTKPFSTQDPTITKLNNHYTSVNAAGKACMYTQANGLSWQHAPQCPQKTIKTWTANGYRWGKALDSKGLEYDCKDGGAKPLQCSQMASALGKKGTFNGKQYFTGREKDGRDCMFLSNFKVNANNAGLVNKTPECDQRAIGFEQDASGHFWGWDDVNKRKCVFKNAKA